MQVSRVDRWAIVVLYFTSLLGTGLGSIPPSYCGGGWTQSDNFCYKMVSEKQTWSSAQTKCHDENARLPTIESLTKRTALNQYLETSGLENGKYWVGARAKWDWNGTSSHCSVSFQKADLNKCLSIEVKDQVIDKWLTLSCNSEEKFLCELPLGSN